MFIIDWGKLHMTVMLQYLQLLTKEYNKMLLGNLMERGMRIQDWRGTLKCSEQAHPSATLSITNPTCKI
jgi:hypothetical protein